MKISHWLLLLLLLPLATAYEPPPAQINCAQNSDCSQYTPTPICSNFYTRETIGQCTCEFWSYVIANNCWRETNNCGTKIYLPNVQANINAPECPPPPSLPLPPGCQEQWVCGPWTKCQNGGQDRGCTDLNGCGTINNQPTLQQECNILTIPKEPTDTQTPRGGAITQIQIDTNKIFLGVIGVIVLFLVLRKMRLL